MRDLLINGGIIAALVTSVAGYAYATARIEVEKEAPYAGVPESGYDECGTMLYYIPRSMDNLRATTKYLVILGKRYEIGHTMVKLTPKRYAEVATQIARRNEDERHQKSVVLPNGDHLSYDDRKPPTKADIQRIMAEHARERKELNLGNGTIYSSVPSPYWQPAVVGSDDPCPRGKA